MLNLLRMNFYRAVHDKGMLTVLLLCIIFIIFSSWAFIAETREIQDGGFQEDISHENSVGIIVNTITSEDGGFADYILYYSEEICSGIFVVLGIIAVVIFFQSEEKDGFIKNIAGQTKHRFNIFFSKFIIIGMFIFVMMLLCIPVQFLILKIYSGGDIGFGVDYLSEFFCTFAIQYLLCLAFLSGVALVMVITKSAVIGILIGILSIFGLCNMLLAQICNILNIDIEIYKYLITYNIYNVRIGIEDKVAVTAIIIGFVFLIIYNMASTITVLKRDIV